MSSFAPDTDFKSTDYIDADGIDDSSLGILYPCDLPPTTARLLIDPYLFYLINTFDTIDFSFSSVDNSTRFISLKVYLWRSCFPSLNSSSWSLYLHFFNT